MKMAKSHTRKKSVKSKPALSPVKLQVIGQATDKIKKWTRHEISRLQHDQQTAICVPVKDGYRVGLYALRVYNNKTCDVRDHNNEFIHNFDNKISAILYTIYRIKCQLSKSNEILSLDQEINKNYVDVMNLTKNRDSALRLKDYGRADIRDARLDIALKRLEIARDKISKIHKSAKYTKIWE
jgi:hypothetical protein